MTGSKATSNLSSERRTSLLANPARFAAPTIDPVSGRITEDTKTLQWDAANMKFTNSDEANKYTNKEYRAGWGIKLV